MRFDNQLVREILEHLEQASQPEVRHIPEPNGCTIEQRRWHVQMLLDGGYIRGMQLRPYRPLVAVGLTLRGQRLLDDLRVTGGVVRSVGDVAVRIVGSTAIGLLMAKARSIGANL